ncbi:adenosine kinase [Iamia sp.]|uniref:adenosine kinase n=1 Tax=Iamia sp. TaxID=2722710 RepID=UPI002BCFF04A|nr:adenosine kinase [Iamia sp.]HXH55745.1 adenosine kinase [Iamia sp.]
MTTRPTYDVVGIGNALVDVLSHEDHAFIDAHDLTKGAMVLIDDDRVDEIYSAMGHRTEMSGGSAANTLVGVASFGGRAAYIGRVRDDELGAVFAHDMASLGVDFDSPRAGEGPATGQCLIVVTPDAQRTMNTYLGASSQLGPDHLDLDVVRDAKVTFLEGYLFDRDEAKAAYRVAAEAAHEAGREVALTLSDGFCVERHRDDFLALVDGGVDILFANTDEITRLYEVDDFEDAVAKVRGRCKIACLTKGRHGSVIIAGDATHEITVHQVPRVVDTTAAGDLYAAGFLYGYTQDMSLDQCGRLGSIAAAAVIGHTGARPGLSLAQLVHLLDT